MKFQIPIGDWSDDGHGKCEYFPAESDKSLEEIREAHFKMEKVLGFTIHDFCNIYEQSYIEKEYVKKISETGFDLDTNNFNTEQMAKLWVYLLNKIDPTLNIRLTEEEKLPMLPFYGFDKKQRHISQVGYGLFF